MMKTAFLDENLSPKLAEGMAGFGERVRHVTDLVQRGAKDTEWIPVVAQEDGFVIGSDARILRNPTEAALVKAHKLSVVVFPSGLSRCDQVRVLVKAWSEIKRLVGESGGTPVRLQVNKRGSVKRLS